MNSLSLGFLYIVGLTWLLFEVCMSASGGNWMPLWIFLAGFAILFAVLGCLPISTKAVDTVGPVSSVIIGASLLIYGVAAFDSGVLDGTFRCLGGLAMVALGVIGYTCSAKSEAH